MSVEQKLFDEIDKICKATDLLQTLPLGEKVKLLEFRTHLCDLNGATKDALDIVVKAEDSSDKIRTYFIEINGVLAKTVTQSSTETYGNAVAFGITGAILAENWDNPFAWFMAAVSAGAYHTFGKVVAIPIGDKAEKEAKIVAANLYDSYINLVKNNKDDNLIIQTDKSKFDTFTKENMENILTKLPSDANLTIAHSSGDYRIDINASKKEININSSINLNEKNKQSENFVDAILSSGAEVVTINSHTYNIKSLSNLQILNAIDNIPEVSFLLSNILIKAGEEMDLGDKGIYKVKSNDTLSTIAQRNGMITKDLLKLNTWLLDENRVKFLQNKILVDTTLSESELNNVNHTLIGDSNAENLLIDANGGDNEFIGGSKKDIMQSKGKGFDTYYAGNKDIMEDSDGKGEVHFNNINLTGAKEKVKDKKDTYEDDKFIYKYNESSSTLKVLTKDEKQSLTIKNYKKDEKSLRIELLDENLLEFAILSDTTGSMSGAISSVQSQAINLVNLAFSKNKNARIGVFGYNDPNVQTFTNLTNDKATIISAINSLSANGGGDTPEMTWHGVYNVAMSNWSKNSKKRLFVFGDAPAKDNDFKAQALEALNIKQQYLRSISNDTNNTIQIFTIQTGNDSTLEKEFRELANLTGGEYINLTKSNYDSVADVIFDSMNLGTNSNETIIGNEKDNIINGKSGDDVLQGGKGSDTYIFEANFGKNIIIETNKNNIDKNIIKFTDDTTINELSFTNKKDDLIIKKEDNQITIKDFYKNEEKISFIEFKDGKTLSYDDILTITSKDIVKFGLKDENYLNTNFKSAYLKADTNTKTYLSGGNKNDILIGGNENDNIDGEFGKDILIGGKGDDKLQGGFGDDFYIYHKGDGKDIIKDSGGNDTLILKGLSKDDVELSIKNKDLVINVKDTDDSIIIKNHYRWIFGKHNEIENIIFDKDNKLDTSYINDCISSSTINKAIEQLNSYSDNNGLVNIASNDIKNNTNSMQIVMSGWGS